MLSRAMPSPKTPDSPNQQQSSYNITEAVTFITEPGATPKLVVTADQPWIRATFTLETAGPVEVSAKQSWTLSSGNGQTLITNVPLSFTIARGNKFYIASSTVNRVRITIEPVPWLEQTVGALVAGFTGLARVIASLRGGQ